MAAALWPGRYFEIRASSLVNRTEKRDFAYELKFLLPESVAGLVLAWAGKQLVADPNGNSSIRGCYRVNSLYFDTTELDVYHRKGSYGRCKYRVRRYGQESSIFLERKLKTRGQVGKRRTRIGDEELAFLAGGPENPGWDGFWFHRRLLARRLIPQCQIAYERAALIGMSNEGPIRLTVDRDARAFPTNNLNVADNGAWVSILSGHCILELKYRLAMPALFQTLVQELALNPQPVSKYRLSVQAFGWVPLPANSSTRNVTENQLAAMKKQSPGTNYSDASMPVAERDSASSERRMGITDRSWNGTAGFLFL